MSHKNKNVPSLEIKEFWRALTRDKIQSDTSAEILTIQTQSLHTIEDENHVLCSIRHRLFKFLAD